MRKVTRCGLAELELMDGVSFVLNVGDDLGGVGRFFGPETLIENQHAFGLFQ